MDSSDETQVRCARQLQAGAALREWDEQEPPTTTAAHLARIYAIRAEHVRQIGLPVLGIDEAVGAFTSAGDLTVTLAQVEGRDGYNYHLFLGNVDDGVVACIATPQR